MADISMCVNNDCARKKKCYRFSATPNPYRQSYILREGDGKDCEDFLDNSGKKYINKNK